MVGVATTCSLTQLNASTWLRRKEEIEALQQEHEELENHLLFMEMKCMTTNDTGELIEMNCNEVRSRAAALVAKRRREASEAENKRLKKLVQVATKQCEAFQASLDNAELQMSSLAHGAMTPELALRVELVAGRSLRFTDASIVGMLERKLEARVGELSEALMKMRVGSSSTDSMELGLLKTHFQDDQVGSLQLSLMELMPFEMNVTEFAMWALVEAGKFPAGDHSRMVRRSKDSFAIDSELTLHLASGGTIDINDLTVLKKFQTPTGGGMLVESRAQWTVRLPGSEAWTHMTREAGCFVMSKCTTEGKAAPRVSAFRSDIRLEPSEFVGPTTQQQPKQNMLSEVVIPSFRRIVLARRQFVENSLLDIVRL
ncbi:uncharacterized protein IUM83_01306 [Phytophthora cinnamomi]|uniref:uncharacterized protein n=1 Tax=Phytophthora cinnamomi TaxID=4785 RepID=UPI0035595F17|nr:hypothetical protein IUM83_01306 [Phytophthora cinnamomi]